MIQELLRNSNLRPSQWKSAYIVRCPSTSYALCAYALSYETAIFPSATAIITFYSFWLWRTFFVAVYTLDIRLSPGWHSKESIPKEPLLMNLQVTTIEEAFLWMKYDYLLLLLLLLFMTMEIFWHLINVYFTMCKNRSNMRVFLRRQGRILFLSLFFLYRASPMTPDVFNIKW